MKFYVHWETEPAYAQVVKLEASAADTVGEVVERFRARYARKRGAQLPATLTLRLSSGKPLAAAARAAAAIPHGADVVAEGSGEAPAPAPAPAPAAAPAPAPAAAEAAPEIPPAPREGLIPPPPSSRGGPPSRAAVDAAERLVAQAAPLVSKQQLRAAVPPLAQAAALNPRSRAAAALMTDVCLSAGQAELGARWARLGAGAPDADHVDYARLGDALLAADEPEEARQALQGALQLAKRAGDSELAEVVQIKLSKAMWACGAEEDAIVVLQDVIGRTERIQEGVAEYARIADVRGKPHDAVRVAMQALVLGPEDKPTRKLFATLLRNDGCLQAVLASLEGSRSPSGKAEALAFLATVAKDHGAMRECIALYRAALDNVPDSGTYALNLVHAQEVQADYAGALASLRAFCAANAQRTLPAGLRLGDVEPLLDAGAVDAGASVRWVPDDVAPFAAVDRDGVEGAEPVAHAAGSEAELAPEQLDMLALLFAATKILYVTGALPALPALIELIEPERRGRELHKTLVRNESAYYCCIAQLLARRPDGCPAAPPAAASDIYVCSDSHTLSMAWRTVAPSGRLLRPALVTGLKHWHLRPDTQFYPRKNFENVVRGIPDGATVLFNFGEIDCREGILFAVEKLRYPSVEAGMRHTIGLFMDVARRLRRTRGFRVLVHPVVPVLNETRHLVKAYNELFKAAVDADAHLTWLDFFPQLLSDDGESLREGLELDGTHLAPEYLEYLGAALPAE